LNFTELNAAGFPKARGLYDPAYEHDSCGVGFIARLDNVPQHLIVTDAIQIIKNIEHRGAVGGDKGTGDGAGLLLQLPDLFFRQQQSELNFLLPGLGNYAVGMFFLPTDIKLANRCQKTAE